MGANTRGSSLLKFFDRYFGIPLIFLLGLPRIFRRQCLFQIPPAPKIALLHTAAIGDTVLISGVILDLKGRWPQSEITFFTGPSNYEAACLIEGIEVVRLPVTSVMRSRSLIQRRSFDIWIDFGSWARINALFTFLAKSNYKIGFRTPGQHRHFVYEKTALHQPIHELDNYRNLIQLLSPFDRFHPPAIRPIAPEPKHQMVFHLYAGGSRASLKQWPDSYWVALIDAWVAKGVPIVLTGAKSDFLKCEQVRSQTKCPSSVSVVAGNLSLEETAKLLKSSLAVVSVDTGIMHLAAALGCITFSLHGPTSPKRWGGIGPRIFPIVQSKKKPCINLGFEKSCSHCDCMEKISVDSVLEAIETTQLLHGALFLRGEEKMRE